MYKKATKILCVLAFLLSGLTPAQAAVTRQPTQPQDVRAVSRKPTVQTAVKVTKEAAQPAVTNNEPPLEKVESLNTAPTYDFTKCPHGDVTFPVYVGKKPTSGTVTISNTATELQICVNMNGTPYVINALHIWEAPLGNGCGDSCDTVPNPPAPGKFPFKLDYSPAQKTVVYTIPISQLNCNKKPLTCNDHVPLHLIVHLDLTKTDDNSKDTGFGKGSNGRCWSNPNWGYCIEYDFCCNHTTPPPPPPPASCEEVFALFVKECDAGEPQRIDGAVVTVSNTGTYLNVCVDVSKTDYLLQRLSVYVKQADSVCDYLPRQNKNPCSDDFETILTENAKPALCQQFLISDILCRDACSNSQFKDLNLVIQAELVGDCTKNNCELLQGYAGIKNGQNSTCWTDEDGACFGYCVDYKLKCGGCSCSLSIPD